MGYYQSFLEKQNRIEEELKKENNKKLNNKYKEKRREYCLKNKDRINQKAKEYYWKNRQHILEKNKMKKLYTNEYYKEWYQKNRDQVNLIRYSRNVKKNYIPYNNTACKLTKKEIPKKEGNIFIINFS